MPIELRILGALEVVVEGRPLALGGRKQRALLALLALHANELIPSDRLLEEIWPDSEPGAAAPSLHVYISQLRKALGDSAAIQTRSGGYALTLAPDQLDASRFERLLREGRQAFAAGDSEQARATLTEALSLWRGPALADLTYESFAERESARLEELRLEAIEGKLEAELQLGRHTELVSELDELVTTEPLRERLRAQLMLALYRSGRQAEALESYREGRQALVDELGLEPSPELKELEAAILRQDSSLAVEPQELRARRHLPAPATPLVGRRSEVDEVVRLLSDGTRLVTLTGAGGTGKTRLALQAAHELAERFHDGVYFVGLAPVHDPRLVPATIAGALGVRGAAPRPFVESLTEHLRSRRLLLVLDNFEHVDEAAPLVSELLAEASGLKALVTSRTGLRLYGEHEYPVPPLTEEEAVELFAARAQAARPGFALAGAAAQVAELVRRLDGLPLAIELAAARSSELSPEQMLGFLTNRLELVTQGPRDVAARQQTLRATIEWSYDLLDEAELTLFARLGVFAGGCTLPAAEEVCAADLETLASLVGMSLVREQEGPDGDPRFEMLETIREYAAGRLEDSGEAEELRRRHAQHFLALAEEAEPNLRMGSKEWFDRLEREHDNLRAALDRLESSGENELGLRLAGAVWWFWEMADHFVEGRRRLESALRSDERPTAARAKALNGAADMAVGCGDPVAAWRRAEEALALHRKLGDAWGIALSLYLLGQAARDEGDLAEAQQLFDESARRFRELGDEHSTHVATRGLAWTCAKLGDPERARALYEDDLRRARATSNKRIEAYSLSALAMMAVDEGRAEDAVPMLKETDRISRELGDSPLQTAFNLCRSANALAFAGRAVPAARLLSWAEAQHEEHGVSVRTWLAEMNEETLTTLRTQLDEAAFSEAWEQGRRMTVDEAFALALDL